jgi:hypothetical protein
MRTTRVIRLRSTVIALFTLAVCSFGVCANTFSAEAVGAGTLVARFVGLEISATLAGEVDWTGEAVLNGRPVRFSARGTFNGFGIRGITTMITEGWVSCSLSGSADDGEAVEICGLLYVKRKSVVALAADEPIIGLQYTVLLVGDSAHAFYGDFTGTAQGQLEPADAAMTIQLGGAAIVHLTAEAESPVGELPASIPFDHPALSPEMLQHIDDLLSLASGGTTDELPEP